MRITLDKVKFNLKVTWLFDHLDNSFGKISSYVLVSF